MQRYHVNTVTRGQHLQPPSRQSATRVLLSAGEPLRLRQERSSISVALDV